MIGMTKVWARELGRHGIRVNAIAPGFTATEMIFQMPDKIREEYGVPCAAGPHGRAARRHCQWVLVLGVG